MKKYLKILSLPVFALILAACNNNQTNTTPVTTAAPESTTVAATTQDQVSTPLDSTTTNEATTTEGDGATTDQVASADVPFTFYVNGEEVGSFVAKDAVGGSVLAAMESIEGLEFTFDEGEGIITEILGNEVDFSVPVTWVYTLNKQLAEFGVVSQTLAEGDVIDWYFVSSIDEVPTTIIPAEE